MSVTKKILISMALFTIANASAMAADPFAEIGTYNRETHDRTITLYVVRESWFFKSLE